MLANEALKKLTKLSLYLLLDYVMEVELWDNSDKDDSNFTFQMENTSPSGALACTVANKNDGILAPWSGERGKFKYLKFKYLKFLLHANLKGFVPDAILI